ncbi:MAG: hypothetical protein EON59_01460 [Alphaproteobacteria bacterium]|nr:MAG: hypothetical protein EON59_01460 [Alphaproteobacteria bacterium]
MHILQDRAYFESRAAKARALAVAAQEPGIRGIHLQMATRYENLARADVGQLAAQSNVLRMR